MEKSVEVFNFEDCPVRTVVGEDGEPWFVARDVCEILEISKYRDAVATLDEDEGCPVEVDTPGGAQKMVAISESGLYTLIIRSNKPKAKIFRKWVTAEVLPSIRKTGRYELIPALETALTPDKLNELGYATRAAANVVRGLGYWYDKRKARRMVNALVEEATGCDLLKTLHRAGILPAERPDESGASVGPFLQDYVEESGDLPSVVNGAEFYNLYHQWCRDHGFAGRQLSAAHLLKELQRLGGDGIRRQSMRLNGEPEKCLVFPLAAQERLRQKFNLPRRSRPAGSPAAAPGAEVIS